MPKSPTPSQSEASRRNGARSRGPLSPRTPAPSRAVVLNTEDTAQYQQLLHSFLDHFAPITPAEVATIEHYAAAEWRLRRAHANEAALLDLQIDADRAQLNADPATRAALALQNLPALDRISQYETRLSRLQQRALRQFQTLKNLRPEPDNSFIPNEEQPDENPSETQPEAQS